MLIAETENTQACAVCRQTCPLPLEGKKLFSVCTRVYPGLLHLCGYLNYIMARLPLVIPALVWCLSNDMFSPEITRSSLWVRRRFASREEKRALGNETEPPRSASASDCSKSHLCHGAGTRDRQRQSGAMNSDIILDPSDDTFKCFLNCSGSNTPTVPNFANDSCGFQHTGAFVSN